jgi:hypothetical protein
MDATTNEIIEIAKTLPKAQQEKILCLTLFLHWQKFGGTKTADICKGERIYNQHRAQLEKATV